MRYEWTMAQAGVIVDDIEYYAWYIDNAGQVQHNLLDETYSIRPVFYLINDIEMIGKGTIDKPYIIN